jgi:tRNA(His) 5'-end guanylyltransferase
MVSQLAAQATLSFYRACLDLLPDFAGRRPTFDARVWQVPSRTGGANVFVWREQDAVRNSITMAASSLYSHKELQGKNSNAKQEMLFAKGVNWNDYPASFKRGTYLQKRVVLSGFSSEEIDRLPAKHEARANPNLMIERSCICEVNMPRLASVINREAVVFDSALPELAGEEA